jgi:RNA polymerase sigma-70 factor (ECF subfamily)
MLRCPSNAGIGSPTKAVTLDSAEKTGPWSPRPDEELMEEYVRTGSPSAFEELVRRYERDLYGYLRGQLGDAQLAEDAFQATFLQVHLKCHQFQADRRFRPWLYAIATHKATDLQRRNRRHKAVSLSDVGRGAGLNEEAQSLGDLLEASDAAPTKPLELAEDRQKTRSAVDRIPARFRQPLDLVAFRGLRYREAADAMGIPLGTFKSRMNKALRILHEEMLAVERPVAG